MNTYDSWKMRKWSTPLSDLVEIYLESLINDKNGLLLKFAGSDDRIHVVKFPDHCPYRNIDESYRTALGDKVSKEYGHKLGKTWFAEESDFLNMLREDPIWQASNVDAKHFVFVTGYDIIEVISSIDPEFSIDDIP
jgi:hypothetical protein